MDPDRDSTHDRARAQFGRAADRYVTSAIHAAGHDLDRLVEVGRLHLGELAGREALDVATGGGHAALALARAGMRVVASDLTPEMLRAAEAHLRREAPGAHVRYAEAAAEALPFERGRFALVGCRIAAHHFADPAAFAREAARVLEPGGLLVLIDNVAPEDDDLAAAMNEVERRRDPSHVEAYPVTRWLALLADAGLEPVHLERFRRRKRFVDWAERMGVEGEALAELERFVLGLPERERRYLAVETDDAGRVVGLEHESALLAAQKPAWG